MKKTLKHFKLLLDVICKALLRARKNLDTKKNETEHQMAIWLRIEARSRYLAFNLYVHY